jgi:hypothetical protein
MRTAIVSQVKTFRSQLDIFVAYHLSVGFDKIYLFFDDPNDPSIEAFAKEDRIVTIPVDAALKKRWTRLPFYKGLKKHIETNFIARQPLNMAIALDLAYNDKIDWLLHIDPDEVFYCPAFRNVNEHFAELSEKNIYIVNYCNHEAIPESSDIVDHIREVTLFKKNFLVLNPAQIEMINSVHQSYKKYYYFYGNGKSATRVVKGIQPFGPHNFVFSKKKLEPLQPFSQFSTDPCILHYPCCGFASFWDKYQVLGNFKDIWFDTFVIADTFPVHVESRDIVNKTDMEAAKLFYQNIFIDAQLKPYDLFMKEEIYFRVSPPDTGLFR